MAKEPLRLAPAPLIVQKPVMLTLRPLDPDYLQALAASPMAILSVHPNRDAVAELALDIGKAILDLYGKTRATAPWMNYFAIRDADNTLLGTCGFKAPPEQGMVEIAYFTFPGYEGQGIAGIMARELLKIAFAEYEVAAVLAHTLPEENASTAILRRRGFALIGIVEDPDDGTIWRWGLERP